MYLQYFSALIRQFIKNEQAASGIEYAIVAAMVAVVIIGFMTDIGGSVKTIFTSIKNGFSPPAASTGGG
jgi:pilus assembly protein Flp/PilA